jgi:hypothetical protein
MKSEGVPKIEEEVVVFGARNGGCESSESGGEENSLQKKGLEKKTFNCYKIHKIGSNKNNSFLRKLIVTVDMGPPQLKSKVIRKRRAPPLHPRKA